MHIERSDFMFGLAKDYEIPLRRGQTEPFTDEALEKFTNDYLARSDQRDAVLMRYVENNPSLFRLFIPFSERAYDTARQIVWYADEIIIRDPISIILRSTYENFEHKKWHLVNTLQSLYDYRDAISGGYMLLYGTSSVPPLPIEIPNSVLSVIDKPEVHIALRDAAYYGYEQVPDIVDGRIVKLLQVKLDSGEVMSITTPILEPGATANVTLPLGRDLSPISQEEFISMAGEEIFHNDQIRSMFAREVHRAINVALSAQKMRAAAMYDRPVDVTLLANSGVAPDKKPAVHQKILDLTVPHVKGVEPERLLDIRTQSPNAFIEFRGKLWDLVSTGIANEDMSAEELKSKFDIEISSHLNKLQSELQSEITKANIIGRGIPLVMGLGTLAGWYFGLPAPALMATALGGITTAVTAHGDNAKATEKAKGHPFYFLWKSQRK
jgi:hypothetical protein